MNAHAGTVVAWLHARGRHVEVVAGAEAAEPTRRFMPIAPRTLRISRTGHRPWLLHLATRATAAWSPHSRCWVFSVAGAELDGLLGLAAQEGSPARLGLLALGGADRVVPRAPDAPSGLFIARASAVERAAVRTFGRGDDRRLLLRVDAPPWRHLALLDALDAA